MDEPAFHQQMSEAYAAQEWRRPSRKERDRPEGVAFQAWKNRHHVGAKLPQPLYRLLMAYCREHDLSVNRAIQQALHSFLQPSNG